MDSKQIVTEWFSQWEKGDFKHLPIADHFKHTSPFGTIEGKQAYMDLVEANQDKFLGQTFEIHDGLYEDGKACVRYTARQGKEFALDVSEWYYLKDGLIEEIHSYYHIGEVRQERQIEDYS